MSMKLKALGLGLLAMIAVSGFAAVNATGETGGHFTSDSPNGKTVITGTEKQGTSHTTQLAVEGLSGIHCEHALYEATAGAATVESLTVTPTYTKCTTSPSGATNVVVDHNGCNYTFTIGKKIATVHQTVSIVCPAGKAIVITHPECEITVPPQTLTGITYNTVVEENKHAITLVAEIGVNGTPKLTTQFHAGFCVLLGTTHLGSFTGSVTVKGYEDQSTLSEPYKHGVNPVNITATGIQ